MGLLELAKRNLDEYISIIETINFLAITKNTPVKYVALFLLSQRFETDISTYEVDKYYIVQSNDEYNWGVFNETNNILRKIAEIDDPLELYYEINKASNVLNYDELAQYYWKRSDLFNYKLMKSLRIDWFFRLKDIQDFVEYGSYSIEEYNRLEIFSDDAVKNLLKSCVPSYFNNSNYKHNLIDEFVNSILDFFDCDYDRGYQIEKDELKSFLRQKNIIIKNFNNDFLVEDPTTNELSDSYPFYHEICLNDPIYTNLAMSDNWNDAFIDHSDNLINSENDIKVQLPKQIEILSKNYYFTVFDAACLISLDEPDIIYDINYNDNFMYSEHKLAIKVIENGIKAKKLEIDKEGMIPKLSLQNFLLEQNILIIGFNDNLPIKNSTEAEQLTISKLNLLIKNLNNEIAGLKEIVDRKDVEVEQLKNDIQKEREISVVSRANQNHAEKEIIKLQKLVKQLEADQVLEQTEYNELLSLIFDESATERYAPDLVLSIKLWESIYINNPKNDSHSNKANGWITMNTGYDLSRPSAAKLREITTPFVNWSTHRDKNYKK
ncbi:hypothetical protein R4666_03645 [Acinetobacter baumannii]|nr:hypothetical protein [Acinetobacter baumannii]